MNNSIVSFHSVSKQYPAEKWGSKKIALQDFSFSLPPEKTIGLLGSNGAGKTTVIKLLLGLIHPDAGQIQLFAQDPQESIAKANVGYLSERPYFPETLTGNEFLHFHRSLYGKYLREDAPRNSELLELVGLNNAGDKTLQNYSKGMLQRIGIAQAILNNPELLILDEPMSGLDPVGRYEIKQIIRNLSEKGKTVLFSTHILSDAEELCDEIVFLENGRVKLSGNLEEFMQKTSLWEIHFELKNSSSKFLTDGPLAGKYLDATHSNESGWRIKIEKNDSTLQLVLETLWSIGAKIKNILPVHKSLEETLFGSLPVGVKNE